MLPPTPLPTGLPLGPPAITPPGPEQVAATARLLWGGPAVSVELADGRLRDVAMAIDEEPDNWSKIRRHMDATKLSGAYLSVRFKQAAGLPMRSYALWMKFEKALQMVIAGARPKAAAADAGFADQSHLGRAARRFAHKSFWKAVAELKAELAKEARLASPELGEEAVGPAHEPLVPASNVSSLFVAISEQATGT